MSDNVYDKVELTGLQNIGIITDSAVTDINNDGQQDIVAVGEWMRPLILINRDEELVISETDYGFNKLSGLWNNIAIEDINNDGQDDIFIGNIGQNTSITENNRLYIGDFDNNGSTEQILCEVIDDKVYPVVDFDLLRSQVPAVKKKVTQHKRYAQSDLKTLFGQETMDKATYLNIDITESILYLSSNDGFEKAKLPQQVQYSSTHTALLTDVDNDGTKDIILGGNHYLVLPQYGRADASTGWLLLGSDDDNNYKIKNISPLSIKGEMRDIELINQDKYIFGVNDQQTYFYSFLNFKTD